jgi:hypothetical protein
MVTLVISGLESAPVTWCVIGPDVSLSKGVEVLLATGTGTVLLVTHEHVKDLVLPHTGLTRNTTRTTRNTTRAWIPDRCPACSSSAVAKRTVRAHDRLAQRQTDRLLHRSRYRPPHLFFAAAVFFFVVLHRWRVPRTELS